ncbi:MAG: ATP-binding cassette domain-containing protein, partial [Rhizobiaceae bacterium]|nr:ATP-binding cassette domain-containing protein [Rhizobiaceae bacterium]
MLEVRGLTKVFGGLTAVNDISFTLGKGEILSIIGPNGAGKSTCFKLIASFLTPTSGTVRFEGQDITGIGPSAVARHGIVRTFQ